MNHESLISFVAALRSVAPGMAKDNSRYAISGVLLDPLPDSRDARLVATDGHCMLIARVSDLTPGLSAPVILSALAIKALTAKGKDTQAVDCEITAAGCSVKTAAGTSSQFSHVEGNFPPYKEVIPSQVTPHEQVQPVSPKLLAAITGWMEEPQVQLVPTGATKGRPILMLAPQHPDWLGIIMPVNLDDAWKAWPKEQAEQVERVCGRKIALHQPEAPQEVPAFNLPVPVAGQITSAKIKVAA